MVGRGIEDAEFFASLAAWVYRPRTRRLSTTSSAVTTKPTYMSLIAVCTFAGTSADIGFLRPGTYPGSASAPPGCCPGYEGA